MSWMEGVGPVKDVSEYGRSKGLSKHWYSKKQPKWSKRREEIKGGDYWDVIDNPLYQVAAEALGYDWDDFVKDSKGKVGTGPKDGVTRVRAVVKPGTPAGRVQTGSKQGGGFTYTDTPGTAAEYEWMTIDEAKEKGLDYEAAKTSRWRNKKTGEIHDSKINPNDKLPKGPYGIQIGRNKDWEDEWEELRDWGVHDEGVAEDLDKMSGWLHDIVSINDHLPKTIREGPKGEHYGIEGDIWEHYGLDKEPEPPKKLDWDSAEKNMVLPETVRSTVTYSTPGELTPVDLHSD